MCAASSWLSCCCYFHSSPFEWLLNFLHSAAYLLCQAYMGSISDVGLTKLSGLLEKLDDKLGGAEKVDRRFTHFEH